MKDNFSADPGNYVKFRPGYPGALYSFLFSLVEKKETAWDCGTGNGQIAKELAKQFNQVYATDISKAQLDNAYQADNIFYKNEPAETTDFPNQIFDLITVGQAIHWFDFESFYAEVKRTMKPGGIIAVMGYGLFKTDDKTDKIINKLYTEVIGSYWDKERKYIDENYQTIPFPFNELNTPPFNNIFNWTFEQLIGYLNTWSAVQHYIKSLDRNPLDLIYNELKDTWGENITKVVNFPILMRTGTV